MAQTAHLYSMSDAEVRLIVNVPDVAPDKANTLVSELLATPLYLRTEVIGQDTFLVFKR